MIAGLRKIGVDCVVTDEFSQALSQSKASALLTEKVKAANGKPVIMTCSFAAQNFVKEFFPELAPDLTIYPSAQQEFGALAKDEFAKSRGLDPAAIRTINITNANENAAEAHEHGSVDFTVNARELYRIFLRTGVDPKQRRPSQPDSFGLTSMAAEPIFVPVKWSPKAEQIAAKIAAGGNSVQAAVTVTLGQARTLLEQVQQGASPYDVIVLGV